MREIRFRGKSTKTGEWEYGGYDKATDGKSFIVSVGKDQISHIAYTREVEEETVCQFTGMQDKNGEKIYEGDIVCTRFPKGCEHEGQICSLGDVRFENGCFGAVWTCYENNGWHSLRRFDDEIIDDIEVLGNIWDNHELLGTEMRIKREE